MRTTRELYVSLLLVAVANCTSAGGTDDGLESSLSEGGSNDGGLDGRDGAAAPQPLPSCAGNAGPALTAWTASSLERIGSGATAGTMTTAEIWAARGEYESFQVAVRGPLTNASVTVSDLVDGRGAKIAASNVTLFREHYLNVSKSSPDWGGSNRPQGAGEYPDALIPFVDPVTGLDLKGARFDAAPFALPAAKNQPIWFDVLVPRDVPAGTYGGTAIVTSDEGSACIGITLHVWKFTLPLRPTLKSSFLVWTAGSRATSAELLRNRLAPSAVTPSDERGFIDELGLGSTNLGFFSGADVGHCSMNAPPSATALEAAKAAHQSDLFLYDYSADEIGGCTNLYPTIRTWGKNLHAAGIANLVTMAPTSALFDDGSGTGRSAVDAWVVLPVTYDGAQSQVAQAIAKGDEVWSYNTLVQDAYSPKWEIDFSPIDFRIQPGFINQALGLTGLLYWSVDRFTGDPWTNINNTGTYSSSNYPGEAMLVYPGDAVGIAGVAPSMRLKWLRDGVDDFEYIAILKGLGHEADAMTITHEACDELDDVDP